jgi:hypothetical protein
LRVPTASSNEPDPILAIETAEGGLHSLDGRPVWPVRNDRERRALERMAASLGGRVEFTTRTERRTLTGPGLVVGLGARAFEDAELYAHLSERACRHAGSLEELRSLPVPDVVVTTMDQVNEDLLDLLYDGGPLDCAPGLVFAYDDSGLREQVLARSAARRCPPQARERRRVDVYPLLDIGRIASPDFTAIGALADREEIRSAMTEGAGVLTLSTHSDGLDAQLRPDLVLCCMDRVPERWERHLAPSCLITGTCHRRDRPVAEALRDGSLLSAGDLVADILVHCVCWGLYPAPGVQAPAWSLIRRVIENFRVGAVVTTWEIVSQSVSTTAGLYHDIARGVPVGRALALHLSSPEAVRRWHRLCLVGDPDMRLTAADIDDPLEYSGDAGMGPETPSQDHVASLSLLRMMVVQGRKKRRPDIEDTSDEVLAAIAAYEEALLTGMPREERGTDPGPLLRRSMVDYFAGRHTDGGHYWVPYTHDVQAQPGKDACPACGRRTVSRVYRLTIPGARPRRHTHCPSCGPVADLPDGRRMALAVEPDGIVRLDGDLPRSRWEARLVIETQVRALRRAWAWPAGPDGSPVRSFRTPEAWPAVPLRAAVIMIREDCEIDILGCLCRGEIGARPAEGQGPEMP